MSESTNSWQHLGRVFLWVLGKLQGNEQVLYMTIARKCIGYSQYTTDYVSYESLSNLTGISLATVKRIIPKLIESRYIIKLATNKIANTGKLPYKYQLNMKLAGFPSLGNNLHDCRIDEVTPTPEPEFVLPPLTDYFIINGQIALISDPLFARKLAIATKDGIVPNPTAEQLTNYLRN